MTYNRNFSNQGPRDRTPRTQRAVEGAMRTVRGWQELTVIDEISPKPRVLARISTLRFGLTVFAIAAAFTIYIGHVYQSQDLLNEINIQRRENVRLHLQHNRTLAEYNAATGPSVIYRRVQTLGLQDRPEYEYVGAIPADTLADLSQQ